MALKVAVIQFNADGDKERNILRAILFVKKSIDYKAKFILLPEVFNFRGEVRSVKVLNRVMEAIPGPSTQPLIDLAKKHRVYILAGSILEKATRSKAYNTSVLISPTGKIEAKYRKTNLFDAKIGKKKIRESRFLLKGNKLAFAIVSGFQIGLSICFDLRFPILYQAYAREGVSIHCVPSSFTKKTGQAHWETLLRARAIETLSYVLAPNQVGQGGGGVPAFGHSMVIDPWGKVLVRAGDKHEKIIYATITKNRIVQAKKFLPALLKLGG